MGSNSVQQLESQLTAWNPHGALPRAELPNTLGDRSDREILEWLGQLRDKETELIRLHQLLSAVMPEVCTVCADYEAAPQQPSSSGSQSWAALIFSGFLGRFDVQRLSGPLCSAALRAALMFSGSRGRFDVQWLSGPL
ncbi:hypothetical protein AK812_SmicGene40062 [Symbiodinium microadriaticum]|uniref:Uncharacterized protein n=1 Tax=Symbiodinium microadriaticum TaxID=2951 RepID=A0A1Q9C9L9_SYMMI|nr:hypothetical protein AK812_SmicGene40062 [Symbiodinium microadriaticum]